MSLARLNRRRRYRGQVRAEPVRNYSFLECELGQVFVHSSDADRAGIVLRKGATIEFTLIVTRRGARAIELSQPEPTMEPALEPTLC